jgi:hypothetical protein
VPFPKFTSAGEEAEYWETHTPLDYPEYFKECDLEVFSKESGLWERAPSLSLYRPDLGNIPLPFGIRERH